ncbi:DUF6273 domain-containing protein, partial [Ruminococcaceae bacterium OttesenSCG-928-I18]|nr:DUF6273 domain-containing protein [Ruminococcaceae bacterium OttesenSCG-928-I18]
NAAVRAFNIGQWWLRTPYEATGLLAYTATENGGGNGHYDVTKQRYLRPAFNLDLSSVLFTSAVDGKPATAGSVLESVLPPAGPLKLTVRDDTLVCDATVTGVSGKEITFGYEITGTCNRLSAIIQGPSGEVKYYGHLVINPGPSGTATVTVPDGLTAEDTLLVFAEQVNTGIYAKHTDFASQPYYIVMPEPTGLAGVACTTSANNDGKITGTNARMEYSLDGITWKSCGERETTGLAPGKYFVRYSKTVNGVMVWPEPMDTPVNVGGYTPSSSSSGSSSPPASSSPADASGTTSGFGTTSNSVLTPTEAAARGGPPQTGDDSSLAVFVALGLMGAALLLLRHKRKR